MQGIAYILSAPFNDFSKAHMSVSCKFLSIPRCTCSCLQIPGTWDLWVWDQPWLHNETPWGSDGKEEGIKGGEGKEGKESNKEENIIPEGFPPPQKYFHHPRRVSTIPEGFLTPKKCSHKPRSVPTTPERFSPHQKCFHHPGRVSSIPEVSPPPQKGFPGSLFPVSPHSHTPGMFSL